MSAAPLAPGEIQQQLLQAAPCMAHVLLDRAVLHQGYSKGIPDTSPCGLCSSQLGCVRLGAELKPGEHWAPLCLVTVQGKDYCVWCPESQVPSSSLCCDRVVVASREVSPNALSSFWCSKSSTA